MQFEYLCQSRNAQQGQRKAGREQRSDINEVGKKSLSWRRPLQWFFGQAKRAMQKTARPAGIYHEIADKLDRFAVSLASERNTRVLLSRVDQRDLIPIFHTQRLR